MESDNMKGEKKPSEGRKSSGKGFLVELEQKRIPCAWASTEMRMRDQSGMCCSEDQPEILNGVGGCVLVLKSYAFNLTILNTVTPPPFQAH